MEKHSNGAIHTMGGALSILSDAASASVTYVCEALPGSATSAPVWRCRKVEVTGNITRTTWVDKGNFSQVADNRASLVYA